MQLYTVRDNMYKNPKRTLRQLSEIGYRDVECAGYSEGRFYGMKPQTFKRYLDKLGLSMTSGHCQTGADAPEKRATMINDWERAVADAAEVGQKYLVCAYLHDFERTKIDDYQRLSELFNRAGETCREYGITFGYHNHDFEFIEMDGQLPYDVLLSQVEPQNMQMELDLYWIHKAGKDPMPYFREHAGRFPLWHIKDMDATEEQYFTEVGRGVIDWPAMFQAAEQAGMQHFYVEQDFCRNHAPMESVEISYNYLSELKY